MRNGQKIDLGMTGYAELFMTDEERKTQTLPRIVDIPIEMIDDFPDHPFKVRMDEDMQQLVESIKERGLIHPVILRKKEDGRYEIVWPEKREIAIGETEVLFYRDHDKLYFSEWYEDPAYHENVVIRSIHTGEVLERFSGSMYHMPDGRFFVFHEQETKQRVRNR